MDFSGKHIIFVAVLCLQVYECACKKKLGIFWGSNLAQNLGQEDSLRLFCDRNVFDIIIITSMTSYIPTLNLENLPSLDFSGHCGDNVLSSEEDLTSYLKCPNIEKDIKYCQTKGIKIFLDIRMTTGFQSKKMAIQFADQVWGLFLGGNFAEKWRTFGSAVLDGINLTPISVTYAVETRHIVDFIRALRKKMIKGSKDYYLTFSPNCDQKPHALYTAFQELYSAFDSIYVNFAQPACKISQQSLYMQTFQEWKTNYAAKSNGPLLYISTTTQKNSPTFVDRNTTDEIILKELFQTFSFEVGGMIFNDASWDSHNVVNGLRYSDFVKKTLVDSEVKPTPPPPRNVLAIGHSAAHLPSMTLVVLTITFVTYVTFKL